MTITLTQTSIMMKKYIITAMSAISLTTSGTFAQTTAEQQKAMSPDAVLTDLLEGNKRYVSGELKSTSADVAEARKVTSTGQYPKATILSCLDSRVPVELVFDQVIGDIFVGRVAGNIVNEDQIGSMEFATKLAGSKLVMVLGHTNCGAVKGACDGAELGNLTALLKKIQPAVDAVKPNEKGDHNSSNKKFVNNVVEKNVALTVAEIRKQSPVLVEMEKAGTIKIVGGVYDLESGKVTMLNQ